MNLKEQKVNLVHIESRSSKIEKGRYEFYVDCKAQTKEILLETIEKLKEQSTYLHILSKDANNDNVVDSGLLLCSENHLYSKI